MAPDEGIALEDEVKRLRWQCRRGMKELDLLLTRFLDQTYSSASSETQANFVRLLAVEDDQLWAWVLGRSKPEDPGLDAIVQRLCGAAVDRPGGFAT